MTNPYKTSAKKAAPGTTAGKILDAAESLFAENGYDGVSIRAITKQAKVELALANYHFGTKQALFCAVVERRAEEINNDRMALLKRLSERQAEQHQGAQEVGLIIDAFTRPFLERSERGGGWKNYARLIAQIANSPRWTKLVMSAQFDPVAETFVQQMKCAIPGSNLENIYWGFHFLLGAMTLTFAETGRIDRLSNGRCKSTELREIHGKMLPFFSAGFLAICASNPLQDI